MEPGQPWEMIRGRAFFVRASMVNEVNVYAVNIGHKLRPAVELFLKAPPVVVGRPVVCQFLV